MAYINLNKLKKDVINSWDNDKHRTAEASRVHGQEHHHLMLIIERQPTVDAVPRAKLEKIFEEIEASLHYKLIDGEIHFIIREADYNEVKKKYTEDNKE